MAPGYGVDEEAPCEGRQRGSAGPMSGDRRSQGERRAQSGRMVLALCRGALPAVAIFVVALLLGARRGAYYLGLAGYALIVAYLLRADFRARWLRH